jgi:hypothetical protein
VPPRCFFPKQKGLPPEVGDVRKNLITVPSCNDHNGKYSDDDEYASLIIRLPLQVNVIGQQDFLKKGFRTIRKKPGLIPKLFQKVELLQPPVGKGVPVVKFDFERVNRVMERVARGLFFHHFRRRWECNLSIISDGPIMEDISPNPMKKFIRQMDHYFLNAASNGNNPRVFWYKWVTVIEKEEINILRMRFFEGWLYQAMPE